MKAKYILSTLLFIGFGIAVQAQIDTVRLKNASFEDFPRAGGDRNVAIKGWYDCGLVQFPGETAPDIHPVNAWEVTLPPSDGSTYLGMVVRDNDSWESVSQRLSKPLQSGQCYKFNIDIARSSVYRSGSRSRSDDVKVQYTRPAVLRIWGANGYCGKRELLAESVPVENFNWATYDFKFTPKQGHLFIVLEAFYKTPVLFPYNGHVLVDNASEIIQIPCNEDDQLLAAVEEPKKTTKPKEKPKKEEPKVEAKKEEPAADVAAIEVNKGIPRKKESTKQKLLNGMTKQQLKEGQTIKIENVLFRADDFEITNSSHKSLNDIFEFLEENKNIMIEIGGHTNGVKGIEDEYCDKLSEDRAKSVADFLINKGLNPERLSYRGYGKRKPIATNRTREGRRKNQRVEIKILSLGRCDFAA